MPIKPSLIDLSGQPLKTKKGRVSASRSSGRLTSDARETSLVRKRSESSAQRPKVRPAFIICTHIKSDCICVRRAKSQENFANTDKAKRNKMRKSISINTSSPALANLQTRISTEAQSAPDYYSRVWSNMVEEASRRVYNVSNGNHK